VFYYYYNVCLSMLYDLNELTSRVEDFEEMFFGVVVVRMFIDRMLFLLLFCARFQDV
jgi:hypothetical protein